MKKLIILLLLCSFLDVSAQRQRKVIFDADFVTPADSGLYGVAVKDNQPYLINHFKDTLKFKMEYPYIRAWSTGKDLAVNLTGKPLSVVCLRDSVTFTLPSPSDTLNRYVKYDIMYLGARGGTGANKWLPFNSDYLITFSDTIWFLNPADNIVYFSETFSSSTTAKPWFRIKPNQRIVLEILNKKWYLSLQNFDY